MHVRQYTKILLLSLPLVFACAERRPFAPVEPVRLEYRGPFENREAEELALWLSDDLLAPESLYTRVKSDLQAIRDGWADASPELKYTPFLLPMILGRIRLNVDSTMRVRIQSGLAKDFDSLNSLLHAQSIELNPQFGNVIDIQFEYLWNPCHLKQSYAKLNGVLSTYVSGIALYGGQRWHVSQKSDSIYYVFQDGWGDCAVGCIVQRFRCFVTAGAEPDYWGEWVSDSGIERPKWFYLVDQARSYYYRCPTPPATPEDRVSPARVDNLQIIGDQVGATANLWFTLPGDDGWEGRAKEFTIKVSHSPLTDSNWSEADFSSKTYGAGLPESDTLIAIPVDGRQTNFIAVRVHDGSGNWSKTSNNAVFRNIWLNGWTYFHATNSPLPSNKITCMIRDARDRLWLGTYNGLACKDGDEWQVYQTSNSAIPYDLVTSVAEGHDGVIWVGTPHGLGRFDGSEWHSYTKTNSDIPKEEISRVAVALDGTVWLGYGQYGAVSFDQKNWTVQTPANSPLKGTTVYALSRDSRGVIWIGTNRGVNRVEAGNWTAYDPTNSGIGGLAAYCFFEDADGTIWIGTSNDALSKFDGLTWSVQQFAGWNVNVLAQFNHGPIWVGADGGVWRHEGDSWLGLSGATTGLPANHCTGLIAENPDVLWIGTATKGLCRWDLKAAGLESSQTARFVDE